MIEVEEYKEMANQMAVSIKNSDKMKQDENIEQDDYIEELEENLDRLQDHVKAQDQYITELEEQVQELKQEVKSLKKKALKQESLQIINSNEQPNQPSKSGKRIKVDAPSVPVEDKENRD